MAIGPTIETERLLLRPPRAEDIPAWNAFHADEDVMRHLGGVQGPE
ncbi:MAG TPA: N-acetyltransferase, partial [Hyphomonas sp.]|nr:N-acetyltransferase [Hyphomonas sp.]